GARLAERRHARAREGAEAGRDAVHRITRAGCALDAGAAALHLRARGRGERDLLAMTGDGDDLVLGQARAPQRDRHDGSLNVLERLALAESAQPRLALAHIARDLLGVRPRVLPERPTDRLADEEVPVAEVRLDVRVEELEVGVALEPQLADDRDPPLPHVRVGAPLAHVRA